MRRLGQTAAHVLLLKRTARAAGVDLAAESEAGARDGRAWRDMVTACRRCPAPGRCAEALAAPAPRPPAFCENRSEIAALAAAARPIDP